MALKALVCPQCGAKLSLDDSNEYGFCQFCGTKVLIHETINVKHSGSITIDNSAQEKNFLQLANNCYSSGNMSEAYKYYLKTLEINPNNVVAVYMKGICAAYESDPQSLRINEYVQAMNQAKNIAFNDDSVSTDQVLKGIEHQSSALVTYWLNRGLPQQPKSNEQGECISEFSKSVNIANLALNAVQLIYSENEKENLIDQALPFIDTVSKTKLQYFVGMKTDKKGRTNPVYKNISTTPDQQKQLNNISASLKDIFNNLPTRVARSSDINDRLSVADEEVNKIRDQLHELKSQRNSKLFALLKDRKNEELKAEISVLDGQIKEIETQLKGAKSVSKGINGELKDFKRTVKK